MDYNIDNILTEWSYRVPTGIIDLNDPYHMVILGDILYEGKYPPGFASKMLEKVELLPLLGGLFQPQVSTLVHRVLSISRAER